MTKKRAAAVVASIVLASSLTGCAMFNKGSLHYSRTTTVGKELVDLQEALEKGAITEEEYATTKKAILEGGPLAIEGACSEKK